MGSPSGKKNCNGSEVERYLQSVLEQRAFVPQTFKVLFGKLYPYVFLGEPFVLSIAPEQHQLQQQTCQGACCGESERAAETSRISRRLPVEENEASSDSTHIANPRHPPNAHGPLRWTSEVAHVPRLHTRADRIEAGKRGNIPLVMVEVDQLLGRVLDLPETSEADGEVASGNVIFDIRSLCKENGICD